MEHTYTAVANGHTITATARLIGSRLCTTLAIDGEYYTDGQSEIGCGDTPETEARHQAECTAEDIASGRLLYVGGGWRLAEEAGLITFDAASGYALAPVVFGDEDRVQAEWQRIEEQAEQIVRAVKAAPQYAYALAPSINDGEYLITVDAGEAGAMFVVGADGSVDLDVDSDGCERNPHDPDGDWPEPPADLISEAVELALATLNAGGTR